MIGEAQLAEYLDEIRREVCSHCVERPPGGPPCAPLGKQCGVEMHLPQLIEAIREVHSLGTGPYIENIERKVCDHCPLLHKSECPCPMGYPPGLIIEAVETVASRDNYFSRSARFLPF